MFQLLPLTVWLIMAQASPLVPAEPAVSRIAFGSCAKQNKPQPALEAAVAKQPDLFIYLGDNIYGDTRNKQQLHRKYRRLGRRPEFRQLKAGTRLLATWDDHDYGENDAGRHYPMKEVSKQLFLEFWEEPAQSNRWKHPGIYHSVTMGPAGKRIQVILLDTRTFRDDLIIDTERHFLNEYQPNDNPDSTFLGAEQWAWLEKQLRQPADLRIIASSNQFAHDHNGWESWTNVPHERQRMLDLIRKTRAEGVLFLSGDVHWAEISRLESEGLYPIYDVTSSGINTRWTKVEANSARVGEAYADHNFGLLSIDWEQEDPDILMQICDTEGNPVIEHHVHLSELSF